MEPTYVWGDAKPTQPDQYWWYRRDPTMAVVVTTFVDKPQRTLFARFPHTMNYIIVNDDVEGSEWAGPINKPQEPSSCQK